MGYEGFLICLRCAQYKIKNCGNENYRIEYSYKKKNYTAIMFDLSSGFFSGSSTFFTIKKNFFMYEYGKKRMVCGGFGVCKYNTAIFFLHRHPHHRGFCTQPCHHEDDKQKGFDKPLTLICLYDLS